MSESLNESERSVGRRGVADARRRLETTIAWEDPVWRTGCCRKTWATLLEAENHITRGECEQ